MTTEILQETVQLYSNVTILLIVTTILAGLTIWYRLGRR